MKDLNYYQNLAQEMVQKDRERDRMLSARDDMWHNRWSLPNEIADLRWVHKVVSTDPHDAIRAGARVLSSVEPRIKLHPTAPNDDTRANADKIERALSWHFRNASRRRRASVVRDVVMSALLYDEVVAQVVYMPHQIEAVQAFKGDTRRLEAASQFGAVCRPGAQPARRACALFRLDAGGGAAQEGAASGGSAGLLGRKGAQVEDFPEEERKR